eukprot:scaffold15510_cov26-Tisochrysis_lutea.AAC.1
MAYAQFERSQRGVLLEPMEPLVIPRALQQQSLAPEQQVAFDRSGSSRAEAAGAAACGVLGLDSEWDGSHSACAGAGGGISAAAAAVSGAAGDLTSLVGTSLSCAADGTTSASAM